MSQQHYTNSTIHSKIASHMYKCTQVRILKFLLWSMVVGFCCISLGDLWAQAVPPQPTPNPLSLPNLQLSLDGGEGDWVGALRILAILTFMTMGPAVVLTMTSFTRIIIVFSLMRQALGTQQSPPNQVIIALALFLTVFIMQPVWFKIQNEALIPYIEGNISQTVALDKTMVPIRSFMFKHTREKDLELFIQASGDVKPQNRKQVKIYQLIPAFVLSELKTAFQIGFMIYVPFLVLDMVVASILMAMGMMMLPPILISLPFKLMLFVLVDGWNLLVGNLLRSFSV
jgi:flagellar biosynthesis protein FliP